MLAQLPLPPCLQRLEQIFDALTRDFAFLLDQHLQVTSVPMRNFSSQLVSSIQHPAIAVHASNPLEMSLQWR